MLTVKGNQESLWRHVDLHMGVGEGGIRGACYGGGGAPGREMVNGFPKIRVSQTFISIYGSRSLYCTEAICCLLIWMARIEFD